MCSKESFILNGLYNNRMEKQIVEVMGFHNVRFRTKIVQFTRWYRDGDRLWFRVDLVPRN